MSDSGALAKAEMLAAAKKKLKDFESRRNHDNRNSPTCSVISSEPGGGNGFNGRSSCLSEDSAKNLDFSSTGQPIFLNSETLSNGTHHNSASPFQTFGNGNEWYQAYTQLKTQHDELCTHYAQLHSAYSKVNANGVHVDTEAQITQLQTALSTMVEEKIACQAELRQLKEKIEGLNRESEQNKKVVVEPIKSDGDSVEVQKLLARINEKDLLLSARQTELEKFRRDVSEVQAKSLNIQHERSEAQARVKSLIRENSRLESSVQQLRKDVQMNELLIKQLRANSPNNVPIVNSSETNEKVEQMSKEINDLKNEKSRLLGETAALKSHYAEREHSLQQKQIEMAAELEQLHSHRFSSDDRVQQLEHQLQLAKSENENLRKSIDVSTFSEDQQMTINAGVSEEDVNRRIREAVHIERSRLEKVLDEEQRKREEETLQKDKVIFEREQEIAELEMKYRLIEEKTLESSANGADLLSLSEQLQNEKTTVSRAVAQNRELKSQLIDTEDRMIALTEEKLQLELAKQTAEHQVRELTKQLNLESAGLVSNISDVIASQSHLQPLEPTSENSKPAENEENLNDQRVTFLEVENHQLRQNMDQAVAELTQVRAELRRSNTQNEQMDEIMRQNAEDENQNSIHVELTQAVGRVNDLATENEQLREVVENLSRQIDEERTKAVDAEKRLDSLIQEQKDSKEVAEKEKEKEFIERAASNEESENVNILVSSKSETDEETWARQELEKRFSRAMLQNAELTESIDRLEHINQQLELENDTIADHVILYQHQRKLIRERLRVKDEQLKALEEDRTRTVARCQELQNVLMNVLNKGGVLKEYELSKKAARKASRSYSHSTVDELSGDEDVIVDAKMDEVPQREEENEVVANVHRQQSPVQSDEQMVDGTAPSVSKPSSESLTEQDTSVRRILEIISEISSPQAIPTGQLHCTQCIGEMQEI